MIDNGGTSLTLSGSLGYIDAKYLSYITNVASTPTEVAPYRHVQNTPAWSGSANLDFTMPLGEGSVTLGAGMSFKSKTYQFEIANPYLDQPAISCMMPAWFIAHRAGAGLLGFTART